MPRMFYEIQSSDDPTIPGDWTVRKTLDDSFFPQGADNALTVISGVGLNNIIYYKIVVKSDAPLTGLSPTNFLIPLERTQANGPFPAE